MNAQRLAECLRTTRWSAEVLAEAIDVPLGMVQGWLTGEVPVPRKVGAWLEALCFVHESAEATKPATAGDGFDRSERQEHIPVYAYNLLRNLNQGPVQLNSLFGTDDEGAVFFLVSRALATREADNLVITDAGRDVGSVS